MKLGRQSKILELINKYDIETQEELAEWLMSEGFNVTQATVSRDIRELKLTKVAMDGARQNISYTKAEPGMRKYSRVLKDGFISMIWLKISW